MSSVNEPPNPPEHDGRIFHALSRWLLWPVAVTVVIVIGVSFLLSFQSQTDLAIEARIRPEVAFGWPIIVDGTILISTFAALILQPRGPRVSWYPWANLLLFGGLSIYANGIHATGMTPGTVELFIIGAVPAIGLIVSTHMLVLMLGHSVTAGEAVASQAAARKVAEVLAVVTAEAVAADATNRAVAVAEAAAAEAVDAAELRAAARTSRTALSAVPNMPPPAVGQPRVQPALPPVVFPKTGDALTRQEVDVRVAELLRNGNHVDGRDVAEWMGLTVNRGDLIFNQLLAVHNETAASA
jgi:hypothetical protein